MLSKRAEEEIIQSEKEMKILLSTLKSIIENLKEKIAIYQPSTNKIDDYKAVLVGFQLQRMEILLRESVSVFDGKKDCSI